jgi:hypothetical protein
METPLAGRSSPPAFSRRIEDMKDIEVFGIVVRSVGLIVTLASAWVICLSLLSLVMGGPGIIGGLIYGIPGLLVGLWLLRGARSIASFAFSKDQDKNR